MPIWSLPSRSLAITTCLVVIFGLALPFTPFAANLDFVSPPGRSFLFLATMTLAYLLLVEATKWLMMHKN